MFSSHQNPPLRSILCASLCVFSVVFSGFTAAAMTELSDKPLSSASSDEVYPNILFILDDSGSMELKFMPDGLSSKETRIGMRNHQCNLVYYNPGVRYVVPRTSTNGDVNAGAPTTFTAAYDHGFWEYDPNSNTTTDLSTSFQAVTDDNLSFSTDEADAIQPAYYWKYLGATTLVPLAGDCEKTLTAFNDSTTKEYCTDSTRTTTTCAAAAKTALWRKIIVSSTSGPATADINGDGVVNATDADERQNFANWYSYYRDRMKTMKSAAGRAFVNLTDTKRVGFITINPGSPVNSGRFLTIQNFDAAHKVDWFAKLYSQEFNGSTPLRRALARAGRYFAGKTNGINSGMSGDPVQYSCQQNFSILTTDGYWNGDTGLELDGSTNIGNEDGVISELDENRPDGSKYAMSPRPIFDGASQTYNWNTASNAYQNASCVFGTQDQQRTIQYQECSNPSVNLSQTRTSSNSGKSWSGWTDLSECVYDNSGTSRRDCRNGQLQTRTSGNSGSTWTDWSNTGSCTIDGSGSSRRECRRVDLYSCGGSWIDAQCTNTSTTSAPVCRSSTGAWSDVATCTSSAGVQDASGLEIECQTVNINGFKTQYRPTTTVTSYTGPNQTGSILTGPTNSTGSWTDLPPATCLASAPALPTAGTVTGVGPPSPPEGCIGGSQVWPCETLSAGGGGVTATTTAISVSGDEDPFVATVTTSAAHPFIVGHSVNLTNVTSAYGGFREIIEVPSATTFRYYVSTHPGTVGTTAAVADGSGTATLSGGSTGSLADVAQYYYKTDLRTTALGNCTGALGGSTSVCDNNVPSSGTGNEDDRASWQHMTTFTMGLGLTGTVNYSPTYKTDVMTNVVTWPVVTGQITGRLDFQDIRLGTSNWPVAVENSPQALDDLWHAAVNGRGQYFSAGDPDTVVTSLSNALAGISARVASAAAAATSNLEPVAGDNFAYTAKYKTQAWTGDLEAREIDLNTGAVGGTVIWSAQAKLADLTKAGCDNRVIKLFRSGATDNMVDFKWNTDSCDAAGLPLGAPVTELDAAEKAHFDASEVAQLSQFPLMGDGTGLTVDQRTAAAGANLVNYIRGQRGKEGFTSGPPVTNTEIDKLYRTRESILGDIINAQPVFVKAPFAEYDDAGYVTFKSDNAARTPVVFSASNDGMLHAFYAGSSVVDTNGGVEAWTFIPTMVLPNLFQLASENYQHVYSVDGTPTVGDVFKSTAPTAWKTILVAGLNKGGKGYYALDITSPLAPKALWEFKHSDTCFDPADSLTWYADCHIGYSFNNPVISKLADGQWVVFVTSGYNNVNDPVQAGDGVGYLYVLEALTGKILYKISTGVGTSATPSGLNHINAWSNNPLRDNTTIRVYGADLLGNVWRFDVNDVLLPAGREATLVAKAVDGSGVGQPITTRPELAEAFGEPYIYVATGRFLGATDSANTQTQSVWAFKDALTTTALTNLRTNLRKMTITNQGSGSTAFRTIGCTAQCGSSNGWFADLPDTGERVNIDMKLQLGTLVVASNVPISNACNVGGYAWLNYFNNSNGEAVANSQDNAVGRRLVGYDGTESLAVGINIVRLPSGKTVVIATTSAAQQVTVEAPFDVPPPTGKRVSWREIVQ